MTSLKDIRQWLDRAYTATEAYKKDDGRMPSGEDFSELVDLVESAIPELEHLEMEAEEYE